MMRPVGDGRVPILYIAPWIDLGGSDKGTIDWFKHVDRERWAPSLITTQPSPNRWVHHVEPYAEEVWDLPDLMPGAAFPEFILGFIESRGVRMVHIMNSRLAFDLLADMTCLPEPPAVVVQLHAEEPNQAGYVRYVTRRYGNLVDSFSVTSEHLKEIVADYEIPPSKIEVIHSGVDAELEFNPERVDPLELGGNGVPRILWPGRLVEQKDPMLTLEVLSRARQGAEFVLDFVGDGHLATALRDRAEELGIAEAIRWHPPSQEMARWYRSSDLLLMTSVYEGVPYVVYESLAMGVPVVAPALPGNREFMDADSGVLVDPRDDAGAYAEAIVSLLRDEELRRQMGERSRRRMLEEFSLAEMGRRHDELYERLLARRSASSHWRNEVLLGEAEPGEKAAPDQPDQLTLSRRPPPERTIGVVVPCYRHGIFLDECIASIKAQTLPAAQIVVVDDGSDDPETVEALRRLDDDPEVEVLRQGENRGPSAARNRGLARLETNYYLPIDADDMLLPEALAHLVARLEEAPEDVGFVYPDAQHIGNQHDVVRSPAFNLWLLLQQNYCPAPSLFDRRLFEAEGVAYPEEIVVGHEDWDLVLALAERGIRGIHVDGPTFLYRKQGLSRVNAVDFGPDSFFKTIEGRHPYLYRRRDEIKRRWSPALSIVLMDETGAPWRPEDLGGLEGQTCADFELLGSSALGATARPVEEERDAVSWLQAALEDAQGRWVLLLPRTCAGVLADASFIERLIHAFVANPGAPTVALAAAGERRHLFAQLSEAERRTATPVAVAFERPPSAWMAELSLGVEDSLLADVVVGLQARGPVQWRLVPPGNVVGAPWGKEEQPEGRAGRTLDPNRPRGEDESEAVIFEMLGHQVPRLPELTPGTVRRWDDYEDWTPPRTKLLFRHLDPQSGFRVITAEKASPARYELEQCLGSVHIFPAPGLRRLVHANHGYEMSDEQGLLPEGHYGIGYLEQQPLPLLEGLELRRMPDTGQEILVAGPDDPLFYVAEPVEGLGFVEPTPILPRAGDTIRKGPWRLESLRRHADDGWRHRYSVASEDDPAEGQILGFLHRHGSPGLIALRLREDGRLASDAMVPHRAPRDPRKLSSWAAKRLIGRTRGGDGPGLKARARHLLRSPASRRVSADEGTVIGWLHPDPAPGTSLLFSTLHPLTGDQLVTRNPDEAGSRGYVLDGVLGAIVNPPAA
jgi:glycosyltransferase involved in cell wall biosynthesis